MKKTFGKELVVFWISMTALVCACVSLNTSLEQLAEKGQNSNTERGKQL